jgi:hypothetical protein
MMKRLFTTLLSTSVVCATLVSPMARAQLPKTTVAPGGSTVVVEVEVVKVEKKADTPARKDGAAPFGAMKKAMVEVMQRRQGQPQAKEKQQVQKAADKVAFMKMPARTVQANRDAQIQQFTQQFRPILRAEYHVLRIACALTPEQRKVIARAAEQVLHDAARKYGEAMHRPMTPAQRAALDSRRLIQEGLVAAVTAQLPPEQAARYQAQLARRNAGRNQLTVRNLVARLDRDLILSPEQRNQLIQSLSSHWDDSWGQSPETFLYDNNLLPSIPDQYVVPYLSETQKRIWRSTQKIQGFFGRVVMFGGGMVMENDPVEDEELKEARLAATKPGKKDETEEEKRLGRVQLELMRAQMEMEARRAQMEMEVRLRHIEQVKERAKAKTP